MRSTMVSALERILLPAMVATFMPFAIPAQDPTINSRHTPVTRDMRYREWSLKDLEKNGRRTPEEQRLAWLQISEDFERIQIINNDLTERWATAQNLDARYIEKSVAEIHKRGNRLQANLMFPKKEPEASQRPENDYQVNTLLSSLSGLIRRFIKNPVFGEAEVLDLKAAESAKNDLQRIIELSELVKKKVRSQK